MADKKISELTALTGANVADTDLLPIVDTSSVETKKITFGEFKLALDTATGFVRITGDTMTGDLTVPNIITAGNVDGRDVSADGTKLDGIEAGADITDATNVAAAGAAMTANNLSDLASATTARGNLGLGTAATTAATAYATAAQGALADTATQPADLATVATTGAYGDLSGTPAAALPLAGGTLTGNVNLGDNVKATFGAGSDLQIYHNVNNSYIQDAGTGKLHITSDGTGVSIDKGTSELMATFDIDGAVTLYHDNAAKLATTATGIDVTGTVVADGLTVDGTGAIKVPVGTEAQRPTPATGQLRFNSDATSFEGYDGSAWGSIGGGATSDAIYENSATILENITIAAGRNGMSTGPIDVGAGVTVTVSSGSRWVVI